MKNSSRRAVLHSALLGLLAACTGRRTETGAGGPTGTDSGDGSGGDETGGADTSPCAAGTPGADWTPLSLADYPALAAVGGSAGVTIGGVSVLVAQISADCFVALAQTCTHQGCAIEYRPYTETDGGRFVCPCHGALFGYDGAVLGGPAPTPVAAYPAVREGETVWVQGPT